MGPRNYVPNSSHLWDVHNKRFHCSKYCLVLQDFYWPFAVGQVVHLISNSHHFLLLSVLDDEDTTVTAGSIVTVTVNLHRQNMEVLFENNDIAVQEEEEDEESRGLEDVDDEKGEGDAVEVRAGYFC